MSAPLLAVHPVAVVWLVVLLVTLGASAAVLVALLRHGILLGRAARRLSEELGAVQTEISTLRERAVRPRQRRR